MIIKSCALFQVGIVGICLGIFRGIKKVQIKIMSIEIYTRHVVVKPCKDSK